MAKSKYQPKYTTDDLRREIKNINQALYRARKSDKLTELEKQSIPDRLQFQTVSRMTNAKDRDRLIDYMKNVKGGISKFRQNEINDQGVTMSRFQQDVTTQMVHDINKDRAARRRYAKDKDNVFDEYKAIKFNPKTYREQSFLNDRISSLWKQAKSEYLDKKEQTYVDNYMSALAHQYGLAKAMDIFFEMIKDIKSPKQFVKRVLGYKAIDIPDIYVGKTSKGGDHYLGKLKTVFNIEDSDI